jgi:hypothetical protein
VTLHAAVFTPHLAEAARRLMNDQLQLLRLVSLVDDGLNDGDTAFEVVIFISGQQYM